MMMKPFYVPLAMLLTNEYASTHLSHACKEYGKTNAFTLMPASTDWPFLIDRR